MKTLCKKIVPVGCIILFLIGCTPDKVDLIEYSAPFVTHSPLTINVNGEVSMADGSRGVKDRLWTFPGNGVVDIKDSDNDSSSAERIVHATFLRPGTFNVQLKTNFIDPTVYLDTTLVITVLDNVAAKFTSNAPVVDGACIIEAGQSVTFTSKSTGKPDTFIWSFEGAEPSNESGEEVTVQYNYAGTWDVSLIAYRNKPYGRDTIQVKKYITVLPSNDIEEE